MIRIDKVADLMVEGSCCAWMVELVDTRDLKSRELKARASSILAPGTILAQNSLPPTVFCRARGHLV